MYELIDSHCHLDFDAFTQDRRAVVARARSCGISNIVIPGVRRGNWPAVRDICEQDARIHACYGLHPYLAAQHQDDDLRHLTDWLDDTACVAVGECGLDYRRNQADKRIQLKFFQAQLELALAHDKPVVIHSVRATEDVIKSIRRYPGLRGMVHSYSGSYEQALQLIELGFYISVGGSITYDKARKLRSTAASLPLDSLLLETDAPDQPDMEHAGQRNEPAYLVNVLECLAVLREQPVHQIAGQTTANARALFQI